MPMTLRIALPIAPATETHCGDMGGSCQCQVASPYCVAFKQDRQYDRKAWAYKRLPECIKATLPAGPWTEQRPTEPGNYWVSIRPDLRGGRDAIIAVIVSRKLTVFAVEGHVDFPLDWHVFQGAKWMRREQPADPFAGGE